MAYIGQTAPITLASDATVTNLTATNATVTDQFIQRFDVYTTNQTLEAGTVSTVNSASDLTMTLPASPVAGDTLTIRNSGTGTVTVGRNGSNILSLAEDGTLSAGTSTQLVYVDATIGWDQL
jgi:hypothetical protein